MKLISRKNTGIVSANSMKVGQVAYIRDDGERNGDIILRSYAGFVSLTNPKDDWMGRCGLKVEIIEKGTLLTFEV